MALVACKGTVLSQEISTEMQPVAQITDVGYSGGVVETYDPTCLDGAVGKRYDRTGYVEPGEVTLGGFYDPALSGHQSITDIMTTPVETDWNIDFADGTAFPFTGAGNSFDFTVVMSDGLKFTSTIKLTGLPTYPT